ncbi:MAG: hypothetical protein HDR92_09205, partial [Bacteroides sp.]|nr:hypothetical protein [Bacteroides sp.]
MSKMHFSRFICVAVVALLCGIAAGCGSPSAARRMAEAEETIDTNPDSALAILRTIDPSRLRGEQRALHALLSVKATDKAYLPHRSDSTALIALDYYGDRMAGLRTAEAHYYAGRVAYDLADYPRALKAFHLALRSIEETSDTSTRVQKLKSAIVSQQAQLLTRLRLFNEARPFYREAIKSDSILGETSFMFYDIRDLAFTYLEEHNTDSARIILNRALPVCHGVVPEADTELYSLLALSYLKDRQYDRAAEFIDSIDPYIEHGDRSLTLSIVAQIYDKIGRMDSAVH